MLEIKDVLFEVVASGGDRKTRQALLREAASAES
jgi:hypothetical protein